MTLSGCLYGATDVCATGTAGVLSPIAPTQPTAVLSAPPTLSICDDLTLSGALSSGGGVFPLSYRWNVTAVSSAGASALAPMVSVMGAAPLSSDELVVPSALFPTSASLRFVLEVASRMGGVSTLVSTVVTKSTSPILTVGFSGGMLELTTRRPTNLSLVGSVSLPSVACMPGLSIDSLQVPQLYPSRSICPAASAGTNAAEAVGSHRVPVPTGIQIETPIDLDWLVLSLPCASAGPCPCPLLDPEWWQVFFTWGLAPAPNASTTTTPAALLGRTIPAQRGRQLIVLADTLEPGVDYVATLTAIPAQTGGVTVGAGAASLLIHVSASPLVVGISGGSRRTAGGSSAFRLDASSVSYDPDARGIPLDSYVWSCIDLGAVSAEIDASTTTATTPCATTNGASLLASTSGSSGILNLAAGSLPAGRTVRFDLVASRDTRSGSTSIVVDVLAGASVALRYTRTRGLSHLTVEPEGYASWPFARIEPG